MPAESVVFIVIFTLAFAAIAGAIFALVTKSRAEFRDSDAAERESRVQRNHPEAKKRTARAEAARAKAEALGAIEADEAAGRTPRMTGDGARSHRRRERRKINLRHS